MHRMTVDEDAQRWIPQPTYLKRDRFVSAAYVVYLANHGPSMSVWMVPGTASISVKAEQVDERAD